MQSLQQQVEEAIKGYQDPYLEMNLFDADAIELLEVNGESVNLKVLLKYPSDHLKDGIAQMLKVAIENVASIENADVSVDWQVQPHKAHDNLNSLKNVKNIIAVASGKGGVGKSTTAVNLALALAKDGAKVGILDADIYGPSLGMMLGINEGTRPETQQEKFFKPIMFENVQTMSMAYLITENTPMVWRGPMVSGALQQLLTQTLWDDLDYLVVDMPPGTGDIQLTLAQKVPVAAAVIVTTPQDIALYDAIKGVAMFDKVKVPVLGVIENMSYHLCDNCGHESHLFGEGGGELLAKDYQTKLLGQLPLNVAIRENADLGKSTITENSTSDIAQQYRKIAVNMAAELYLTLDSRSPATAEIVLS